MLIVCPSCATSYLINPDSVGSAGRAVRCARCKTVWHASAPKKSTDVGAFVDSVIAEAEAQSNGTYPDAGSSWPDESAPNGAAAAADDFGADESEPAPAFPVTQTQSPPVGPTGHDTDLVPYQDHAPEPLAIADAPSLVPPIENGRSPDAADAADADTFSVRRLRLKSRRQQVRRSSRWTAIILVLFAFN